MKIEQLEPLGEKLTIKDFVKKYNNKLGLIKGGSLCFYGHWFGRPYDNYHKLKSITFLKTTNTLVITFDENEILRIENPENIVEFQNKLEIGLADKIYWEWFYYGKPQSPENHYFIEITRQGEQLSAKSKSDGIPIDFKNLNISNTALLWI